MSVPGEKQFDAAAGAPICPACAQPVYTDESFARVGRQMLHLRCWIELPDDAVPG